jgi:hypothetical protein
VVPVWARSNLDDAVPALKVGSHATLNADFKEIEVPDVTAFLFYKDVK